MTDAGAPLSRRERRLRAQRASGPELDDLETSETAALSPDGRPLTRRERRALERSARPMETWTAEEEMLATGQLPAMTPDVIAVEERLARERAEQAAREAEARSAELRDIAHAATVDRRAAHFPEPEPTGVTSPPAPEPVEVHDAEPAAQPLADVEAPHSPVSVADAAALTGVADAAALTGRTEPPAARSPERAPFTGLTRNTEAAAAAPVAAHSPAERQADSAPGQVGEPAESSAAAETQRGADIFGEEPLEEPQRSGSRGVDSIRVEESDGPAPEASTSDAPAALDAALPDVGVADAAGSPDSRAPEPALPDSLLGLFPPGSPQARMMEEGAAYARAQAAAPAVGAPVAVPSPVQPVAALAEEPVTVSRSSAVETAEPDLELTQVVAAATAPDQTSTEAVEAAEDPAAEIKRLADEALADLMRVSTPIDRRTVDDAARAIGEAVAESRGEVAPHERELPESLFHDEARPNAAIRTDLQPQSGSTFPPSGGTRGAPAATSAAPAAMTPGSVDVAAPSVWDTNPFGAGPVPAFDPDASLPSDKLQLPDLSQLVRPHDAPTTTGSAGTGFEPTSMGPVTEGIEVPRREVPELQPTQGARDMHWAQFLVIGAVAFVLGLLVYQLMGHGS
ncbi:hypothetical protein RN607_04600 [Demequina capsici]|uniref:Uncharacterized protein n=1 Tax=Demequina capsici TaxID=3075620 RepID=A0AA96FGX6_9MICO|nr:hypothetical protein [Demequina sp. PMTSA13]WNM28286.1 hypothetical protein RN607_04600 [Demequina sp. PMTSA13]